MRYRFDDFELDTDAHALRRGGQLLPLQPKVLDVLRYLIEHPGRLVTKTELLEQLWPGEQVGDAALSWSVSHIRRALGQERSSGGPIETVHRRGYRFVAPIGDPATTRPPPSARPTTAVPAGPTLIGRDRVLAELERHLDQARAGHGSLVLLTGEAGIGKTRCTDELIARAPAHGLRALRGRCPQEPDTPLLWPIVSALEPLADTLPEVAARARALGRQAREHDGSAASLSDEGALFGRLEQIADLLREAVAACPTLLVLDDLHWADAGTRRFLAFLAPELRELPLCVVGAQREAENAAAASADSVRYPIARHAHTLPLAALDGEQVAELLSAVAGSRPSTALAEAVRRASGGVPLFVEEVARTLALELGEQGLDALPPEAVRVPQLARDLLRERVRRLPRETGELLSLASVIGERFDLSLLSALARLEPEALLDRLEPARIEGQVVCEAPHLYRFAHALHQSVLYADLPPSRCVELHREVGALLDARSDREQRKGEIARHYHLALPAAEHATVVERSAAAGAAAARAFAFDDACTYYGWALEAQLFAGSSDPRERAALLSSLASAQRSAGRTSQAIDTAARLIELALSHRLHDRVVAAVRLRRPTVAMASVPDALSRSALEAVLAQTEETTTRVGALALLATLPPYDADLAGSKARSAEALALAETLADPERLLEPLAARLFALSGPGDVEEVLQIADRVQTIARETGGAWRAGDARSARYMAFLLSGRIADADAVLNEMAAAVPGRYFREAGFYVERLRVQRTFLDGRFDAAERRWQTVYDDAVRAGVSYADLFHRTLNVGLAVERYGAASIVPALGGAARQPGLAPPYLAGIARLAAQGGDLGLVRSLLSAVGDPRELTRDGTYVHALSSLSLCNAVLVDVASCELLYELLAPYAHLNTPDAMGYYLGSAAHFLGLLAAALGRHTQAESHFAHALDRNRAMGYRAGVVRTLLADAKHEEQRGRSGPSRSRLKEALALASELGMAGARADAERRLAAS
jgi:DNA-binding winged helix-turn-helix (wHTH) protein/tetratricopeptide (TPR) repeat protein